MSGPGFRRAIPWTRTIAPHCLTLEETLRAACGFYHAGRGTGEVRLRISRDRRRTPGLPDDLNLGEAAWLLCLSRRQTKALIEGGNLSGILALRGDRPVWQIPHASVESYATSREDAHEAGHPGCWFRVARIHRERGFSLE